MLTTRMLTALALLAILLPIIFLNNSLAIAVVTLAFFAVALWESLRLFGCSRPLWWTAAWALAYVILVYLNVWSGAASLFGLCVSLWAIRLAPALRRGLPPFATAGNALLSMMYLLALLGCFVAVMVLFQYSPLYLLSVMTIVWIADIGAYFSGKGFGRHKLAPSISPGKSWEGVIGGWLAVLVIAAAMVMYLEHETFAGRLYAHFGWSGLIAVMTLLVAASVVGDLFESQLKRRAGVKDSSKFLPGHGGVLDRIDALIPVLPLAALINFWL